MNPSSAYKDSNLCYIPTSQHDYIFYMLIGCGISIYSYFFDIWFKLFPAEILKTGTNDKNERYPLQGKDEWWVIKMVSSRPVIDKLITDECKSSVCTSRSTSEELNPIRVMCQMQSSHSVKSFMLEIQKGVKEYHFDPIRMDVWHLTSVQIS